jgi:hypothetical protein
MRNLTLAEIAEALYGRRGAKGVTISVHPSETRLGNAPASTYIFRPSGQNWPPLNGVS